MLTSEIGAYQSTAFIALQQRADGAATAQAVAAQEKPEFKQSLSGVETRAGVDESGNSHASGKRGTGEKSASGRGQYVNILA